MLFLCTTDAKHFQLLGHFKVIICMTELVVSTILIPVWNTLPFPVASELVKYSCKSERSYGATGV